EKISSMDCKIDVEVEMNSAGQDLSMAMGGTMTYFQSPMKMKMQLGMNMNVPDAPSIKEMEIYIEEQDEKLMMYMKNPLNEKWTAQELPADVLKKAKDKNKDHMKWPLETMSSLSLAEKTEELSGGEAYKLSGVLSGETISKMMQTAGVMDSLESALPEEQKESIENLYTDFGDLPMTMWVDVKTSYPVKYDMDMTDILSKSINKALESAGGKASSMTANIKKMAISMEMSNMNKAVAFEIPAEAKAALDS
ncbi:MAG: hypothetical protein RR977_04325, partial [Oscillospiraceae bacterium]